MEDILNLMACFHVQTIPVQLHLSGGRGKPANYVLTSILGCLHSCGFQGVHFLMPSFAREHDLLLDFNIDAPLTQFSSLLLPGLAQAKQATDVPMPRHQGDWMATVQ
eukprot:scaffold118659_cov15-Tisochrysis_lutea.AAC.1